MTLIQIGTVQNMGREQAQLTGGAAALSLQTGLGQTGFTGADIGDLISARLNLVRDGVQERGTLGAGGIAIGPERLFCGLTGGVDLGRAAVGGVMGGAADRLGRKRVVRADPSARDQVFSMRFICHL